MIKIGISGQARSGKNTLAEMIIDHSGTDHAFSKIVAMADPIKNMILQMVPNADKECLWGASELRSRELPGNLKDLDGNPLTYRRALMDIGSLGRKYNTDIWVNALAQDAEKDKSSIYIVSDCRFFNEINYLKKRGFYMIRIKRQDIPRIDDVSETAQLKVPDSFFDYVLENNDSLDGLNNHAKQIINKLV